MTKIIAPLVDRLAHLAAPFAPIRDQVLVVRLDAIGDFLLWSDAARRLAEHYRSEGQRVVLLANAAWADLAEALGVFDDVWRLDRRRFLFDPLYRFKLMRRLRGTGFATAIQPTLSREFLFGDAIVRLAGRRRRIGSSGDLANQNEREQRIANTWYSHLVAADPRPMMELDRNAEFLRGLGIAAVPRIGRLPVPSGGSGGDFFVLFPGASWEAKCWPAASFAALAERIAAATGWRAVVAGGKADREAAAAVSTATNLPLEDLAGRTTLLDLAALFSGARLVVSNDTSAVHLAAAVGTPSVCLLGGGHFGRFLPYSPGVGGAAPIVVHHAMPCYGCNWQCCHPRQPGQAFACVRSITVDEVWSAIQPLIGG